MLMLSGFGLARPFVCVWVCVCGVCVWVIACMFGMLMVSLRRQQPKGKGLATFPESSTTMIFLGNR